MSDFEQVSNGPGNTEDCKDEGGAFKNRMHNLISTKFQSFRSNFDKKKVFESSIYSSIS